MILREKISRKHGMKFSFGKVSFVLEGSEFENLSSITGHDRKE